MIEFFSRNTKQEYQEPSNLTGLRSIDQKNREDYNFENHEIGNEDTPKRLRETTIDNGSFPDKQVSEYQLTTINNNNELKPLVEEKEDKFIVPKNLKEYIISDSETESQLSLEKYNFIINVTDNLTTLGLLKFRVPIVELSRLFMDGGIKKELITYLGTKDIVSVSELSGTTLYNSSNDRNVVVEILERHNKRIPTILICGNKIPLELLELNDKVSIVSICYELSSLVVVDKGDKINYIPSTESINIYLLGDDSMMEPNKLMSIVLSLLEDKDINSRLIVDCTDIICVQPLLTMISSVLGSLHIKAQEELFKRVMFNIAFKVYAFKEVINLIPVLSVTYREIIKGIRNSVKARF